MKDSILGVGGLFVAFTMVVPPVSATERTALWPSALTEMRAQPASKIAKLPDGAVSVTTGTDYPWPGVRMDFTAGDYDLSRFRDIRISLSNTTDKAVQVCLSVKSKSFQGRSPGGSVTLPPHGVGQIRSDLQLAPWQLDKPIKLVGMRGYPVAEGKDSGLFDITRTVSFHIFRGGASVPAGFAVYKVEVGGASKPVRTLQADTFLPFVDTFGQFKHDDWPGKVHSQAELEQTRADEAAWLAKNGESPIPGVDRFGGWAAGPQLKATGFFRVEKVNGKWWLVDPDGRLFFSHGVDCVNKGEGVTGVQYREPYFENLPTKDNPAFGRFWGVCKWKAAHDFYSESNHYPYAFYNIGAANMLRKYGPDWERITGEMAHRRIRAWGLNTIANWSQSEIYGMDRTPYTLCLGTGGTPRLKGSKGWWGALPDPFTDAFAKTFRERARAAAKTMKNDPWCLGVFVDNELSWNDEPRMAAVADRYFAVISGILKEELPNHLYLGCRIAWGSDVIYRAAAKYCDVVSVNIYSRQPNKDLPEGAVDRPMINGEFHFGAMDRGMFHTGLVATESQAERAKCYRDFVYACLDHPRFVGTHWFQWKDQPLTGRSDGENYQIGFLTITDTPYPELVDAARTVAKGMYARRYGQGGDYACRAVDLTDVKVTGGFWLPRMETNRLVTLKTCFDKCNETPRIANFTNAANRAWGTFGGIPFDDSDVFKVMEGAAYIQALHPDPKLERYMNWLIGEVAKAQEPDGYLYTARTLGFTYTSKKTGRPTFGMMGPTRWSNCPSSHELYNVGHMYEAAVAWYETTGNRNFLEVARRNADLIARTFGPDEHQLKAVPGHEEIELALVKLYRATGERRYLDLAKHFVDQRGAQGGDKRDAAIFTQAGDLEFDKEMTLAGAYAQNHIPVRAQTRALGHAVRAGYLYCGMADVAALTGDADYLKAILRIWDNVVSKKLHLNGGIGARHRGEAFGADYELPNETAYLETCAAIANALWNQRLFLTYGDAKYVDVLERVIYNGFLSGVSIGGDEFFYPNPLASSGGYKRSKWFGCSCCPVNDVRFIPQIARFAYATRGDAAYVNLFVESEAKLKLADGTVALEQKTDYPWAGTSRLVVVPERDGCRFTLNVRVPGWCVGRPVPSDLYVQTVPGTARDFSVRVNGRPFAFTPEKGYCVIDREWKRGDAVEISMNMPVRRIKAHDAVEADRGRLAVERGPILYSAEGVDNGGHALDLAIAADAAFAVTSCDILGTAYPSLTAPAKRVRRGLATVAAEPVTVKLIPNFAWCHRGAGEMQTWFPTTPDPKFFPASYDVKVSMEELCPRDRLLAVCDGVCPKESYDLKVPRCTFWPHKGTDEWVSYAFPDVETVSGVEVMWFDDVPHGGCNLPASWCVEVRETPDGTWRPVPASYPVQKDELTKVTFASPVRAREMRVAVKLQKDYSAGLLEWRVF